MPDRVVDASVVAAIAFEEPEWDEARSLIGSMRLHVPTLIDYELANITRTKILANPQLQTQLVQGFSNALG